MTATQAWYDAGIANPEGRLRVGGPIGTWPVPELAECAQENGKWVVRYGHDPEIKPPTTPGKWHRPKPDQAHFDAGLLNAFARLTAKTVAGFASKYGVLGVCGAHGRVGCDCTTRARSAERKGWQVEPWSAWDGAVEYVNAMLSAIAVLRQDKVPDDSVMVVIDPDGAAPPIGFEPKKWAIHVVGSTINWNMRGACPQLTWPGSVSKEWGIHLRPRGLWTALNVQLAYAWLDVDALSPCSGCQQPHVPSRRRSTGISYCPECRAGGVPAKVRKRRERAANREPFREPLVPNMAERRRSSPRS